MQFTGLTLLTWLIVAWAVVTALLVLLMIYRGMIGMHQEDQLILGSGEHQFEVEAEVATARIARLRPYVVATSALSAVLAAAAIGVWVADVIQRL